MLEEPLELKYFHRHNTTITFSGQGPLRYKITFCHPWGPYASGYTYTYTCKSLRYRNVTRLEAKMTPRRLDHIRLDLTSLHLTVACDLSRLQKCDSEWNACHYQKFCVMSGQPGRKNDVSFNDKILKTINNYLQNNFSLSTNSMPASDLRCSEA